MARIRTIKPEMLHHERLWEAEKITGLPLFRCWAGLIMHADREGLFKWSPNVLKGGITPFDQDLDFSMVLDVFHFMGKLIKYTDGRDTFGFISSFLVHQRIPKTEPQSKLPKPTDKNIQVIEFIDNTGEGIANFAKIKNNILQNFTKLNNVAWEGKGREGERTGKGRGIGRESEGNLEVETVDKMTSDDDDDFWSVEPVMQKVEVRTVKALSPKNRKRAEHLETAKRLLAFLNKIAGRGYRECDSNLDFIIDRLASGATEQQCKTLICRQFHDWSETPDMLEYMRPSTLFNKTKFETYLGKILDAPEEEEDIYLR